MPADPASPDPLGRTTTTVYDGAGRPIRAGDPPGAVTTTAYAGACGSVVPAPLGAVTWIRFGANGRVIDRGSAPASGADETPPDEPHIVG